jgi:quercetin dioxygenase-like cupin family protein
VFEPLDAASIAAQKNVHVVVAEPGGIRANHAHRRGTEVMVVYGPALVRYSEAGETADRTLAAGEVLRFTFPPGVAHAVQNTGAAPNLLVCFNTEEHDPANSDVVREVLI